MRKAVLPLLLAMLMACTPMLPGGSAQLPETGIGGAFSRQAVVAETRHAVMVGQVFVLRQNGGTVLTAEVGQTWRAGQGRLRMDTAWDRGAERAFVATTRTERHCLGDGQCRGFRTGTFVLTRTEFEAATREGLRATLIGPDDTVAVAFPAALFAEAMTRARDIGLWPP